MNKYIDIYYSLYPLALHRLRKGFKKVFNILAVPDVNLPFTVSDVRITQSKQIKVLSFISDKIST